ncbi:uncharacterized protein Dmoj_GI10043 [Drosophila mojavensis]|uniref:Secreted protein n=1 Tax=Drosophila mojavensis TaxID=7230 RepID=B4K9A5_DROMO|nr:uncharacterized protein Dmoj_GI10043 [Drosophila mojavensis]
MITIVKFSIVLVLVAQLLTGTAAEAAVGELLGLVGNVGSTLLEPVVCLQQSALTVLQQVLGDLGLGSLATQVANLLTPLFDQINGLLTQILAAL